MNGRPDRRNFPILPVVNSYIKTTVKGANHWAVCPFHNDTSPSMSVSVEKNIFKCFACNISGDAVSFVMRIERCGYDNAIRKVAGILNLRAEDYLSRESNENHRLYKINDLACLIYHKYLLNRESEPQLNYLLGRGLSRETIVKYRLGYAPPKGILGDALTSYGEFNDGERYGEAELKRLGLFTYDKGGKSDFFRDRIIFPILDAEGQVIGFSGRSNDPGLPKYINTRNDQLFRKREALFNLQSLGCGGPIHIFEGFFDVLNAAQIGVTNGIACMGGNIGAEVIPTLLKYSRDVVLCFDNDEAGINFSLSAGRLLIGSGFRVRVVNLVGTDYKDIDELVRGDATRARDLLGNPINYFSWLWGIRADGLGNLIAFQSLIDDCLAHLFRGETPGNIDFDYARDCLGIIFGFYGGRPELKDEKLQGIIRDRRAMYEAALVGNLIASPGVSARVSPPRVFTQAPVTGNAFLLTIIKYQNLLLYQLDNAGALSGYPRDEWFFEIPGEHTEVHEHVRNFFSLLRSGGEPDEAQSMTLRWLARYGNRSLKINSIERFFDRYFSFNEEYLNNIIDSWWKSDLMDSREKWTRTQEIRDLMERNRHRSSSFFRNSNFCK